MKKKLSLNYLLVLFSVFLFYGIILTLPIPYTVTSFFKFFSPTLFFVLIIFYFLSFQFDEKWIFPIGAGGTMLFFALALSYMWSSGYSDNKIIGGVLPYKDAFYYYNGAQQIQQGQLLSINSVQAAGRPIFPGFTATVFAITGNNLQLGIAILVALLGFSCYLTGDKIREHFGDIPAALFISFLFLYAQEQIGYFHTETLGLILGNLGFILIFQATTKLNFRLFLYSLIVLMVAISARAGAFFIFPTLAVFSGWLWRKKQSRFSWKNTALSFLVIIFSYTGINSFYPSFLVEEGNATFGNFSYMLYGQIHGGTGWHRAIEELGTRDPAIVMESAIKFFHNHPISLLIGIAKSYRDFFMYGGASIFNFSGGKMEWVNFVFWAISISLWITGLIKTIKHIKEPVSAMLLASFIGIFLSIPFLPPIDGGKRFYASTMPFFYALLVVPSAPSVFYKPTASNKHQMASLFLSYVIVIMSLIAPPVIVNLPHKHIFSATNCPTNQVQYSVSIAKNSYIDIIQSDKSDEACGKAPSLCFADFASNGREKEIDLFYDELVAQVQQVSHPTRIFTTNNLSLNGKYTYFIGPSQQLSAVASGTIITGCATEIVLEKMKSRAVIYNIETIHIYEFNPKFRFDPADSAPSK